MQHTRFHITVFTLAIMLCGIIGGVLGSIFFSFNPPVTSDIPLIKGEQKNSLPLSGGDTANAGEGVNISNMKNLEESITGVVKSISPSVVSIIIEKDLVIYRSDPWGFFLERAGEVREKVGGGTGFFISSDGHILTNKHVIRDRNANYTVILSDGIEYETKLLWTDPQNDLAIIKIEDSQKDFFPLGFVKNTQKIQVGTFAIAIGNALAEFENSVSLGIISGKNRNIQAENETLRDLLQTDAAINPGNSGGPLVGVDGKVLGINTAIAESGNSVGFAIPLWEEKIEQLLTNL